MNLNLRPQSLAEVAERADNQHTFGLEFQDWLHTIRSLRSRSRIADCIASEPQLLANRFPEGNAADAWLAAYAEHVANRIQCSVPKWAASEQRISLVPWFTVQAPDERLLALRDSPSPFKNRNLFTPRVDLPINLRPGRPPVSREQKRLKNAERQRRFRHRRAAELAALRATAPLKPL